MNYATIENGAIAKIGPRPNWRDDNGDPVTDEVLAANGRLPVVDDEPEHDAQQRATQLAQVEWLVEAKRVVAMYDVADIPLEELRGSLLTDATAQRWQVMTGGLSLPSGARVGTGIDDQNRITSVVANSALAGLTDADTVDFKAETGWVTITIVDIKDIAGLIGQFVQACYSAERVHHDAIEALDTRAGTADYDVSTGWPDSGAA